MRHKDRGFTLIELMIVVSVIAVIAAIAIPNLLSSRLVANESAAISSLKAISAAQIQCQVSRDIDANSDGSGEYGYFGELAGVRFVRDGSGLSSTEQMSPPVLSQAYGQVQDGYVLRSGYIFRLFLPDSAGAFVPEASSGGATANTVAPRLADMMWCCYAWPSSYGTTGRRAFFINQRGEVLGCTNATTQYNGLTREPQPGTACFVVGGSAMDGVLATSTIAADGEVWAVVN